MVGCHEPHCAGFDGDWARKRTNWFEKCAIVAAIGLGALSLGPQIQFWMSFVLTQRCPRALSHSGFGVAPNQKSSLRHVVALVGLRGCRPKSVQSARWLVPCLYLMMIGAWLGIVRTWNCEMSHKTKIKLPAIGNKTYLDNQAKTAVRFVQAMLESVRQTRIEDMSEEVYYRPLANEVEVFEKALSYAS